MYRDLDAPPALRPKDQGNPIEGRSFAEDEDAADEDFRALYMSLVGALAWLILSMPVICSYVASLQRQTPKPTLDHVSQANQLLRWIL